MLVVVRIPPAETQALVQLTGGLEIGPDHQKVVKLDVLSCSTALAASAYTSVLHLRGDGVTPQPHQNLDGDILCWNGEIFEGLDILPNENDGKKLFEALTRAEQPVDILAQIEGPWVIVNMKSTNTLYYARDPLGRRSLLVHHPTEEQPHFIIASSCNGAIAGFEFEEVTPDGIYCIKFDTIREAEGFVSAFGPATQLFGRVTQAASKKEYVLIPPLNNTLPSTEIQETWSSPSPGIKQALEDFLNVLNQAVELRVQHVPHHHPVGPGFARVAVLFSGGIDCTVLAYLAHKHLPLSEPIDLLNVAFENPRTLKAASKPPGKCKKTRNSSEAAEQDVPEQGRSTYDVPDRLTGREETEELRRCCPERTWNFVEIDVPYEECQRERPKVQNLMYPNQTVMDLSLALALFFASRGIGHITNSDGTSAPYTSQARVLLSGLGSDELLGGYSRHRKAFARDGWQGLVEELQLDLTRLPSRNLGRDDRVISSNGKETRYPFLSLSVVSFLANLPVETKVNPFLEEGRGDKMLLRMLAERMGLALASRRKKRAMQFGSRSARMEGGDADRKGDSIL
ncbi:hypothetical protein FS837_012198 [Tulasnella sp. UAMH 9824]|nr:hypothetical protein FS837_012198 [Tulasnella sp. UAMH 9824]